MGAEPFFFKTSSKENAKETYARIMNFFVIGTCICFLSVVLFLDVWKYFMSIDKHPEYLEGLYIVPLLMMSKLFLGVYYNLSIWYKLTNRNNIGALITIFGALVTIVVNYFFIPTMGFLACAVANFVCYGSMMIISYLLGQRYYPIPYNWKKGFEYILLASLLYCAHYFLKNLNPGIIMVHAAAVLFSVAFVIVVFKREKKELQRIPFFQKLYK
jgi:O-antigen/teichoic acid export membrane protein